MSNDQRYHYQYSPPLPSRQAPGERYWDSSIRRHEDEEAGYRSRYDEQAHPTYSSGHAYASSSRQHHSPPQHYADERSYYPEGQDRYHRRPSHSDNEEVRAPAYRTDVRSRRDEHYYRRDEDDAYARTRESWDRGNVQPSYRRSAHSPDYNDRLESRPYEASREYKRPDSPPRASRPPPVEDTSPVRPTMSIFNMLNDRGPSNGNSTGSPLPSRRGSTERRFDGRDEEMPPAAYSKESYQSGRSTYDPARDFGVSRQKLASAEPEDSRGWSSTQRYPRPSRDYSPEPAMIRGSEEQNGRSVASISSLLGDVAPPAASREKTDQLAPEPRASTRESSAKLDVSRAEEVADDLSSVQNGGRDTESVPPAAFNLSEQKDSTNPPTLGAINGSAPSKATAGSGKVSLKLRNNPLPPSKDKTSFYAPPPPAKRGRDADGWDSDLSTDENKPLWRDEISIYAAELAQRKLVIESAYEAALKEKEREVSRRLARAYEGRHYAVMRRIQHRDEEEARYLDFRQKEEEEAARKRREREIELELLGTLSDSQPGIKSTRKSGKSGKASRTEVVVVEKAVDGSDEEGDELEDDEGSVAGTVGPRGPSKLSTTVSRSGTTIRVKSRTKGKGSAASAVNIQPAPETKGKSKKRKVEEVAPPELEKAPVVEDGAVDASMFLGEESDSMEDEDRPLAELSMMSRAGGEDLDESVIQASRKPSPELEEPIEEPTYDANGKVPIDERRAQQLEDAHRRLWTSIAKRDIPKVYRTVQASASNKAMYWRRLSAVIQREAKRGAARNNKTVKDVQLRARKVMREMLVFWKKNEKEERELRKKAEKEALDKAKKEEEMREAKRQARKLNFLISQTELYSHFVGSKLKTSEAEESSETSAGAKAGPAVSAEASQINAEVAEAEARLAELDEIDFDDEDESNLRAHAARNAQEAVRAAKEKAAAFDAAAAEERRRNEAAAAALAEESGEAPAKRTAPDPNAQREIGKAFDSDDMNFLNPTSMGQMDLKQPKMLTCQLKEYQLKGLNWLANLYEQGINGILADEMGLGKTVQSISLMAYLAEVHDIWGPFLVIAPASTLHNWQQEISRFVPALKALPYWGNVKDRAVLRKFWNRKQISYNRDAPFHVLVTSYQLVVSDEKYFQRVKWQYMILDEAQAIKSSSSNRWKTLLGFNCRNRLLLTGTPVQNSMQELWALLHFIMPSLFDSHDEFSEWFSKDIESHAENKGTLNEHQLRRLHMILKPFMLRRIKKNVQNELGDKIEIDVFCDMSARQKMLYKGLREHISVAELMDKASNLNDEAGLKSLMNLVMQFRKVCNHPELFERADVKAPLAFASFAQSGSLAREGDLLHLPDSTASLIEYRIPKLMEREGGNFHTVNAYTRKGFETHYLDNLFNIWRTHNSHPTLEHKASAFSFLPLLDKTAQDAQDAFHKPATIRILRAAEEERAWKEQSRLACDDDFAASALRPFGKIAKVIPSNSGRSPSALLPLESIVSDYSRHSYLAKNSTQATLPSAVAPPIRLYCNDKPFMEQQESMSRDPLISEALFGLSPLARESAESVEAMQRTLPGVPPVGLIQNSSFDQVPHNGMQVPQMNKLIVDSSKLARLDELLRELKAGGHRVLIYFQMTKMIDLMEEYLIYRQYKYLRLDGASKISDRRDMVTDWQTKPELFIFLLSTRAGGLGINLTAADTVVFYDHDWNPSNDSQAMDRAHRLGQTKQVTVYRLITKGTIDERIVRLARNKKEVQDIVVGNKAYSETGMARPQEIVSLLLDDDELAESMLRRKQAEEAQTAQDKADSARAMHAKRRLNKDKAAAAASPAPSGVNWTLEDDEDDFFGARPPPAPETDAGDMTPQRVLGKKASSAKKPRISEITDSFTPMDVDSGAEGAVESPVSKRRGGKSHRKKTIDELAGA
ncbi:hypothetical protein IE53DRAFT_116636 [Violaceomyces palustris]|uniref:Uncharacterized protein n=1 Tax=Violaceomyces palustris TaxID=1673888 RepID=A0ACD0P8N8_9BASI|nr:hypothetical protein IE53DRAFT_116636 [Violaceomyces palustris]